MKNTKSLVPHMRPMDFPRTEVRTAFTLKESLSRQFNYARQHPAQMGALRAQLEFVLGNITKWDQEYADLERKAIIAGTPLDKVSDKPKFIMSGSSKGKPAQAPVAPIPQVGERVANSMGHGFIKVGMNSETVAVSETGQVAPVDQVATPKVHVPPPVGAEVVTAEYPHANAVVPPMGQLPLPTAMGQALAQAQPTQATQAKVVLPPPQ